MSVWSHHLGSDKEYVVLKHRLSDMNGNLAGVKFRGGLTVVEKNSKAYLILKQLPLLRGQPDLPLIYLRNAKFITRSLDVQMVFGNAVYHAYLSQLNAVVEVEQEQAAIKAEEEHVEAAMCANKTGTGDLCQNYAMLGSPSGYCKRHILDDPKLVEVGVEVPRILSKKEKKEFRAKVIEKLEK